MGIVANGFAKNVAQDSAIEAARFGAFADQTTQSAQARAEVALRSRLGAIFQARVLVSKVERGSDCYVKGSVELTYLAVGFLPQPIRVREEALAACELE
jgi:hypothetical protein